MGSAPETGEVIDITKLQEAIRAMLKVEPNEDAWRSELRRKGAVARSERSRRPHAHVPQRLLTLTRVASNPFLVRPEGKFQSLFHRTGQPRTTHRWLRLPIGSVRTKGETKFGVHVAVCAAAEAGPSPRRFFYGPPAGRPKQYCERSERYQWKLHLRAWNQSGTASRQPGSFDFIRKP
jgi:hypothetical protein